MSDFGDWAREYSPIHRFIRNTKYKVTSPIEYRIRKKAMNATNPLYRQMYSNPKAYAYMNMAKKGFGLAHAIKNKWDRDRAELKGEDITHKQNNAFANTSPIYSNIDKNGKPIRRNIAKAAAFGAKEGFKNSVEYDSRKGTRWMYNPYKNKDKKNAGLIRRSLRGAYKFLYDYKKGEGAFNGAVNGVKNASGEAAVQAYKATKDRLTYKNRLRKYYIQKGKELDEKEYGKK